MMNTGFKMMNTGFLTALALALIIISTARSNELVVNDPGGAFVKTRAPVALNVNLSRRQFRAAREGRLVLVESSKKDLSQSNPIPAQLFSTNEAGASTQLCWLMPPGTEGERRFELQTNRQSTGAGMVAERDADSTQFDILEAGKPVLRYNYRTIEPGGLLEKVTPDNRKYARARSDYIHPLFGLDGEPLTLDWPIDHPHHRGIYWAWPEVDWHGQRGDLHALQSVFARPTGKCSVRSGPVFAQIEAENVWKWEGKDSLVHERAIIRAYRSTSAGRLIDLEFQFTALDEPVLLARRGADKYGGLNIRLAKVLEQAIAFHTDATNASPRMAWAELNGRFDETGRRTGLVVFQHISNPDYPGEWVKFPEINWFQPTFPASGTRYELKKGEPLMLRFRLWLHRGPTADRDSSEAQWLAYHSKITPKYPFPR